MVDKKTNKTKEKIYKCAKTLFYQNGYNGTNMEDIAKSADVPISLITYYFKKKILITAEIYSDFYRKITERASVYFRHNNLTSSLLKQMMRSYMEYDIILNDSCNKRFYLQLREKNISFYSLNKQLVEKTFIEYIAEYGLSLSKQSVDIFIAMNSAARGCFFKYYEENNLNLPIIEVISILETVLPAMLGINRAEVDRILLNTQDIIKEIDYSDIKFLV